MKKISHDHVIHSFIHSFRFRALLWDSMSHGYGWCRQRVLDQRFCNIISHTTMSAAVTHQVYKSCTSWKLFHAHLLLHCLGPSAIISRQYFSTNCSFLPVSSQSQSGQLPEPQLERAWHGTQGVPPQRVYATITSSSVKPEYAINLIS